MEKFRGVIDIGSAESWLFAFFGMGGVVEVLFGMVWLPFTLFFVSSLCASLHSNGFSSKSDKWVLLEAICTCFAWSIEGIFEFFDEIVGSMFLLTLGCNFIPTF